MSLRSTGAAVLVGIVLAGCALRIGEEPRQAGPGALQQVADAAPPLLLDPADGFNIASVAAFSNRTSRFELAGIPRAEAMRLESLRQIGEAMRGLGAQDVAALMRALGHDGAPLQQALGSSGRDEAALIWPSFFRSSVLALGHGRAERAEVAFYNPLADGWLVTQWRLDGRRWRLADAALATGETIRGRPSQPLPAWRDAPASVAAALPQSFAAAMNSYQQQRPRHANTPPPRLAAKPEDAGAVRARVAELRLGVLDLMGDREATAKLQHILALIRGGKGPELRSIVVRPSDQAAATILALSQAQRDALLPAALVRRPDGGRSVAMLTRSRSAMLILVEYGAGSAAHEIQSISVIDLGSAGVGGA